MMWTATVCLPFDCLQTKLHISTSSLFPCSLIHNLSTCLHFTHEFLSCFFLYPLIVWLDARGGGITKGERDRNIFKARRERKGGNNKASSASFSSSSGTLLLQQARQAATNAATPKTLGLFSPDGLEDTPEDEHRRPSKNVLDTEFRKLTKTNARALRVEGRQHTKSTSPLIKRSKGKQAVTAKRSRNRSDNSDDDSEESFEDSVDEDESEEEVTSEGSSDDEDDDSLNSDNDMHAAERENRDGAMYDSDTNLEEKSKNELKEMAMKILKKCDKTITNLRSALQDWAGKSAAPERVAGNEEDCIDLLAINNSSNEILKEQDIQDACPNLILKPYQLVGVNWLKLLHQNGVNGVLADDMGLGKTIQTIAFLGWLKRTNMKKTKTHLLVVPASTLNNWSNELEKFCPDLNYVIYHGSQGEREEMRYNIRKKMEHGEIDIILSTYTIFERESCKDDQSFLRKLMFEYVVLDEAHCIKNSESSRYKKLNDLNSRKRLLLSGTPVQNDLKELLALLSFLMPRIFSRSECEILLEAFVEEKSGKDKYASLLGGTPSVGRKGTMTINNLRSMFAPFVLRRLKKQVLDQLPAKTTVVKMVEMKENQRKIYDDIIAAHASRRVARRDTIDSENHINLSSVQVQKTGDDVIVIDGEDIKNDSMVRDLSPSEARSIFTALRKAANHPLLLRLRYTGDDKLSKITSVALTKQHFGKHCDKPSMIREEIESMSDFDIHRLCLEYETYLGNLALPLESIYDSPKISMMADLLPQLRKEGHRILIFSQWTMILDLLEAFLESIDMNYLRLDGSTPVRERQEMIDEFSAPAPHGELHPIPIFLLSTKAGGLGINLTAADTVILHDLDFNPENDRQAEDRSHRIGQTKEVTVYKFVTLNSVDEDIYEIGERKSRLTEAVLNDNQSSATKKKQKKGDDDSADINSIGKILQKALQQHIKRGKSDATATTTTDAADMNHGDTNNCAAIRGVKEEVVAIEKTKMNTAEVIHLISP